MARRLFILLLLLFAEQPPGAAAQDNPTDDPIILDTIFTHIQNDPEACLSLNYTDPHLSSNTADHNCTSPHSETDSHFPLLQGITSYDQDATTPQINKPTTTITRTDSTEPTDRPRLTSPSPSVTEKRSSQVHDTVPTTTTVQTPSSRHTVPSSASELSTTSAEAASEPTVTPSPIGLLTESSTVPPQRFTTPAKTPSPSSSSPSATTVENTTLATTKPANTTEQTTATPTKKATVSPSKKTPASSTNSATVTPTKEGTVGSTSGHTTDPTVTTIHKNETSAATWTTEGGRTISEAKSTARTTTESPQSTTLSRFATSKRPDPEPITYCPETCPDGYTEGRTACVRLGIESRNYAGALDSCQDATYGDLISERELGSEYDAIQKILLDNDVLTAKFFVNEFSSAMLRQNRSVRVFYVSSTTSLLTVQANVTRATLIQEGILALCKVPKHCQRPNCSTVEIPKEAPALRFVDQPPAILKFEETVQLQCINATHVAPIISFCNERGAMQPQPALLQGDCDVEHEDYNKDDGKYEDPPGFIITCDMCLEMGTDSCTEGVNGCECKYGWAGSTCYKSPKFCPNTTCRNGASCIEQVDHAICKCETEKCLTAERTLNRTATIQDTAILHRSFMLTVNGIIFTAFGDPTTYKIDIAERRIWCLLFHFTAVSAMAMIFHEHRNMCDVVQGSSRNQWYTKQRQGRRWDYGYVIPLSYIASATLVTALWFFQWNKQQYPWTSLGSFDDFGMAGWMTCVYIMLGLGIVGVAQQADCSLRNDKTKKLKIDNYYETTAQPEDQEEVNIVLRNRHLGPYVIGVQSLVFITMMLAIDIPIDLYAKIALGVSVVNTVLSLIQSIYSSELLGCVVSAIQVFFPKWAPAFNTFTFRTTAETLAYYSIERYEKYVAKEKEEKAAAKEAERIFVEKSRALMLQRYPNIPVTLLPMEFNEGPESCWQYDYDMTEKDYSPARIKEFTFIRWTKMYLSVRVKMSIKTDDGIEFIRQYLHDEDFLEGVYCSKEADKEKWEKMKPRGFDKKGFEMDMTMLCLANRVRIAPSDPKKRRLLEPVLDMFNYTAPNAMPTILGNVMDKYGLITSKPLVKDVPVITRSEEERQTPVYARMELGENSRWDQVFDDDFFIVELLENGWGPLVQQLWTLRPSHPEAQPTKSANPRKDVHAINDHFWLNAHRPGLMGPRKPEECLPLGPLENRYHLYLFYEGIKTIRWKEIIDHLAGQRMNTQERQKKNN